MAQPQLKSVPFASWQVSEPLILLNSLKTVCYKILGVRPFKTK